LVDATISDSPSLSQGDLQRFVDYASWCQIWSAALMVSVVKSSAKFPTPASPWTGAPCEASSDRSR
jgi:hypothetical protein